jgi:hypothetical protein
MAYRKRHTGTTQERGLGWVEHQSPRQTALRTLQDGDLCARCELHGIKHPMYRALVSVGRSGKLVAPLLDLDDFPGRRFGGPQVKRLSWRRCNRGEGASSGNKMRARMGTTAPRWPSARRW